MTKRPKKMVVSYGDDSGYIFVKSHTWLSNNLPSDCIDRFGNVWLQETDEDGLYSTIKGAYVLCAFAPNDGYLLVIEGPEPELWEL